MDRPDFRPLTIGEILDRAIAVFVRHAGLFLLALVIIAIPPAIVEVILAPHGLAAPFAELQQVLAHASDPVLMQKILKQNQAEQVPAVLASLIVYIGFLWEITVAPVIAVDLFNGTVPSLGRALRLGLARYLPALVVSLGFAVIGFAFLVALFIPMILLAIVVGVLVVFSKVLAIIVGIVAGLAVFAAFVFFGCIASLAWVLAIVAVATEDANPIRAIGSGLRRAFARPLLVRSFLVGLSIYVVRFAGDVLGIGVGAVLVAITHVDSLIVVPATIVSVLITSVVMTFVARYTLDLRIRREGMSGVPFEAPA